jgi:hypothetical protein
VVALCPCHHHASSPSPQSARIAFGVPNIYNINLGGTLIEIIQAKTYKAAIVFYK